jgi:transposase
MEQRKRKSYSREFKMEAVRLITHKGYSIAEASRSLGVEYSVLRNWKKQFEHDPEHAFPGKGRLKPPDEEIRRLKARLNRVTEERDILKKALAYFAEHQK